MEKEKIYVCLRQIKKNPDSVYTTLLTKTKLDYRTIKALAQIVTEEDSLTDEILDHLLDEKFYTLENAIKLYQKGMEDLIPTHFYEDDSFLKATKITKLPDNFIAGNKWIKCFSLHDLITSIGNYAFNGCRKLEMLVLNDNLKYIGDYAFKACTKLDFISLPDSLREIGEGAFLECEYLTDIEIPSNVKEIKDYTFKTCTCLQSIETPKEITVGREAFKDCEGLEEINGTVTHLKEEAFSGCEFLKRISLNCTIIPKEAFLGCGRLEKITFNQTPVEIGENAFTGCGRLKSLNLNTYNYQLKNIAGERNLSKADIKKDNIIIKKDFIESVSDLII